MVLRQQNKNFKPLPNVARVTNRCHYVKFNDKLSERNSQPIWPMLLSYYSKCLALSCKAIELSTDVCFTGTRTEFYENSGSGIRGWSQRNLNFSFAPAIMILIIKINISPIVIGLKNTYFPTINSLAELLSDSSINQSHSRNLIFRAT